MAIGLKSALRVITLDGSIGDFEFVRLAIWTDRVKVWKYSVLKFCSVFFCLVNDVRSEGDDLLHELRARELTLFHLAELAFPVTSHGG